MHTRLTMLLALGLGWASQGAASAAPLDIRYVYTNVNEGYDHTHRLDVYVDGEKVGESPQGPESVLTAFRVEVPDASFHLRVVDMAFLNDIWEEHTVANDYSLDAVYEADFSARKKHKLSLVFDVASETVKAKGK